MVLERVLYDTVVLDIKAFNESRGRRKRLDPVFVRRLDTGVRYRKFGRILEVKDSEDAFGTIRRVAHQVVPTLLNRKPRPTKMRLDIAETCDDPVKLLVRFVVPKRQIS